ncbi:MAG TPA: DUF2914 domain-containing protein [Chitinispirillaceae bacterium]|nr:DUF2914 domain-containing protein [Chitinispirillaceae bacterium]
MRTITALAILLAFVVASFAQSTQIPANQKTAEDVQKEKSVPVSKLTITRAVVALNVDSLEPENIADTFPAEVHRLFCFTQIKGALGTEEIQHRWYWKDELMSTISLKINSGNFRTYSSKSIPMGLKGDWRVSIVDSKDESILGTLQFVTQ